MRRAPKRTKSATVYDDIINDVNDVNDNSNPLSISSYASRTIKVVWFDSRIKLFVTCLFCGLTLIWNQRVLNWYDRPVGSVTIKATTTTTNAAAAAADNVDSVTTKVMMKKYVTADDTSIRDLESNSSHTGTGSTPRQSHRHAPTLSPSSTTLVTASSTTQDTAAPSVHNSSSSYPSSPENEQQPPISVLQWSHWKDLKRIVASIWGGNLFCSTIDGIVQQYYSNHTINVTVAMNVTNTTTNITSTVPVIQQVVPPDVPIPTIHFGIELSCYDLFVESTIGTGNVIQAIYMMRMAVQYIAYAKIQLNITCSDNTIELQSQYVLPWFTGVWRSPHYSTKSKDDTNRHIQIQGEPSSSETNMPASLNKKLYCGSFKTTPTAIMYSQMKYDVRRMAIALTCNTRKLDSRPSQQQQQGTLYPHRAKVLNFLRQRIYYTNNTKSSNRVKQQVHIYADNQQERLSKTLHVKPLIQPLDGEPPITFDDAVIHFRCGDLLSTTLTSYGFLTFDGYSRHISKATTRSIGILTQPFGTSNVSSTIKPLQARTLDAGNVELVERCSTLVYAFVDYLEEHFPNTTVTIRNDQSETIALAYARMVMAKQVIGGMSTFSIFPILGTFGTGYYFRPRMYDPSMWLTHKNYPVTNFVNPKNSLVLFDDKNIMVGQQTKDLWNMYGDDVVLEWFRTGNYTLSGMEVNETA